jgi:excisionase family DNA binding protein
MIETEITARLEALAAKLDALLEAQATGPARFLSVGGAAEYVSLSADSIRTLIASGQLSAYRPVKGKILIDRLELEAVVRAGRGRVFGGRGAAAGAAARTRSRRAS